jgi:mRNA interferase HigB
LLIWEARTKAGSWKTTAEVVAAFSTAKAINGERVRFKVDGNNHRMIVAYYFPSQTAYIKFLGTHDEYDDVDAATVDQSE